MKVNNTPFSLKKWLKTATPGVILKGSFWPEPIKIIEARKSGNRIQIKGEGVNTQKLYPQLLSSDDLKKISISYEKACSLEGKSEQFFLGIEAKRIRFACQFDPFYAISVSQIDPLPHQITGIYHHVLKRPKARFLIADDAGGGKTIMAGLLLKELKYRGLVDRTLIVIPSHLKHQWLRELKEKFNEKFLVIDRGIITASWGRNIWQEQNQIITSVDFGKQEDVMVSLAETDWDLIIVDEAHKMAAYRYGDKTKKTNRYKLGELLSRKTKFLIFLTATPHRGDPENFRLFLNLLEPNLFASIDLLKEAVKSKENPPFIKRLKEDFKNFDGTPLFPPRKVRTIKYRLSDDEKRLYNAVTEYVQNYYQIAQKKEKRNVTFALMILQRRLASSTRAVCRSLERRRNRLGELLQKGRILQEEGFIEEEYLEDLSEEERWREEELLERLTSAETLDELKEEIKKLDELVVLAKEVEKKEIEVKLEQLKEVIESKKVKENQIKLLIFTEAKDTLEYLVEKIRGWGFTTTFIHGGLSLDRRIEAESEFKNITQVMVATEAAGEGINLQFCWLMVNYDIPWNPNRLEQRMGRIHRYGQQNEVHIYNLIASDTKEGRVLAKLFDKLEKIKEHLGSDRVFDVIGEVMPGRSFRNLIEDAITNRRTMEDILKEFDKIPDEELIQKVKEATLEGLATKHIDLTSVIEETRLAKENRLVPEFIERFFLKSSVQVGLKVKKLKDSFYRIPTVPYNLKEVSYGFKTKYGAVFDKYKKISFIKEKVVKGEAEFVAPGHPLLETVIEKILIQTSDQTAKGATFLDPSGRLEGLIWFLELEIKDGQGETAGKRIYVLYQDKTGSIGKVPPSILWDLKPSKIEVPQSILDLQKDIEDINGYAIEAAVSDYMKELREIRERDAEIKRKYGLKSLDQLILESESKLVDYETRLMKGISIPEVIIQNEKRNKERLTDKKERLEEEIEAETSLLPSVPKILGIAAVMPAEKMRASMKSDEKIEKIGMRVAMEYEKKNERKPKDVSRQNLGFDIKSRKKKNGEIRYIEVKARAKTGSLVLTPNEWLMAERLSNEYWLYVVENAATKPKLHIIQNPRVNLKVYEEKEIIRYIVKNWKSKAKKVA